MSWTRTGKGKNKKMPQITARIRDDQNQAIQEILALSGKKKSLVIRQLLDLGIGWILGVNSMSKPEKSKDPHAPLGHL